MSNSMTPGDACTGSAMQFQATSITTDIFRLTQPNYKPLNHNFQDSIDAEHSVHITLRASE